MANRANQETLGLPAKFLLHLYILVGERVRLQVFFCTHFSQLVFHYRSLSFEVYLFVRHGKRKFVNAAVLDRRDKKLHQMKNAQRVVDVKL